MGSVKDLEVISKPTRTSMGTGRFHFSDRYSVFDWGEMPDHIEGKGASLCLQGAYCFEKLEQKGINTHYKGLVNEKGKTASFEEAEPTANTMEIKLVNVYKLKPITQQGKLKYDYSTFTPNLNNFLIPLEVVYRNGLPAGSSVFKRLEQGITTINDLGLDHYPSPGERLTKPIFDASTKLEEKDRYVTWEEAQKLARLTDDELDTIKDILLKVDQTITEIALGADLDNEDGKIELAFDTNRRLMVVDVVGTLDECRFTYNGLQVSKEIARQFYRKTEWFNNIEEAKKAAEAKGIANWKSLCKTQPPKLDPQLEKIISQMYMAAANEMTNRRMFEVPHLAEIVKEYCEYEEKKR